MSYGLSCIAPWLPRALIVLFAARSFSISVVVHATAETLEALAHPGRATLQVEIASTGIGGIVQGAKLLRTPSILPGVGSRSALDSAEIKAMDSGGAMSFMEEHGSLVEPIPIDLEAMSALETSLKSQELATSRRGLYGSLLAIPGVDDEFPSGGGTTDVVDGHHSGSTEAGTGAAADTPSGEQTIPTDPDGKCDFVVLKLKTLIRNWKDWDKTTTTTTTTTTVRAGESMHLSPMEDGGAGGGNMTLAGSTLAPVVTTDLEREASGQCVHNYAIDYTRFANDTYPVGTMGCMGLHECQFQTMADAGEFCGLHETCVAVEEGIDHLGCNGGLGCFSPRQGLLVVKNVEQANISHHTYVKGACHVFIATTTTTTSTTTTANTKIATITHAAQHPHHSADLKALNDTTQEALGILKAIRDTNRDPLKQNITVRVKVMPPSTNSTPKTVENTAAETLALVKGMHSASEKIAPMKQNDPIQINVNLRLPGRKKTITETQSKGTRTEHHHTGTGPYEVTHEWGENKKEVKPGVEGSGEEDRVAPSNGMSGRALHSPNTMGVSEKMYGQHITAGPYGWTLSDGKHSRTKGPGSPIQATHVDFGVLGMDCKKLVEDRNLRVGVQQKIRDVIAMAGNISNSKVTIEVVPCGETSNPSGPSPPSSEFEVDATLLSDDTRVLARLSLKSQDGSLAQELGKALEAMRAAVMQGKHVWAKHLKASYGEHQGWWSLQRKPRVNVKVVFNVTHAKDGSGMGGFHVNWPDRATQGETVHHENHKVSANRERTPADPEADITSVKSHRWHAEGHPPKGYDPRNYEKDDMNFWADGSAAVDHAEHHEAEDEGDGEGGIHYHTHYHAHINVNGASDAPTHPAAAPKASHPTPSPQEHEAVVALSFDLVNLNSMWLAAHPAEKVAFKEIVCEEFGGVSLADKEKCKVAVTTSLGASASALLEKAEADGAPKGRDIFDSETSGAYNSHPVHRPHSEHAKKLPKGWTEHVNSSTGKTYYTHPVHDETLAHPADGTCRTMSCPDDYERQDDALDAPLDRDSCCKPRVPLHGEPSLAQAKVAITVQGKPNKTNVSVEVHRKEPTPGSDATPKGDVQAGPAKKTEADGASESADAEVIGGSAKVNLELHTSAAHAAELKEQVGHFSADGGMFGSFKKRVNAWYGGLDAVIEVNVRNPKIDIRIAGRHLVKATMLPKGWTHHIHPDTHKVYYSHPVHGNQTRHPVHSERLPKGWTKHVDPNTHKVSYSHPVHRNQAEHPVQAKRLPKDWTEHVNPTTGKTYYTHPVHGRTLDHPAKGTCRTMSCPDDYERKDDALDAPLDRDTCCKPRVPDHAEASPAQTVPVSVNPKNITHVKVAITVQGKPNQTNVSVEVHRKEPTPGTYASPKVDVQTKTAASAASSLLERTAPTPEPSDDAIKVQEMSVDDTPTTETDTKVAHMGVVADGAGKEKHAAVVGESEKAKSSAPSPAPPPYAASPNATLTTEVENHVVVDQLSNPDKCEEEQWSSDVGQGNLEVNYYRMRLYECAELIMSAHNLNENISTLITSTDMAHLYECGHAKRGVKTEEHSATSDGIDLVEGDIAIPSGAVNASGAHPAPGITPAAQGGSESTEEVAPGPEPEAPDPGVDILADGAQQMAADPASVTEDGPGGRSERLPEVDGAASFADSATNTFSHRWAGRVWPHGVLKYCTESSASPAAVHAFHKATEHVTQQIPCVTFELINTTFNESLGVESCTQVPSIMVRSQDTGCYSYLGMVSDSRNGSQHLNLGAGCETMGMALHQIGQALGMAHETSRPDRDDYVTFHPENMKSGAMESHFKIDKNAFTGSPYDVLSIMHYDPWAFASRDELITIEPKNPFMGRFMGQRMGFSELDVEHVGQMYGCESTIQPLVRNKGLIANLVMGVQSNDNKAEGSSAVLTAILRPDECMDSAHSGFMLGSSEAPCSTLAKFCESKWGTSIKHKCPVACSLCVPTPTATTAPTPTPEATTAPATTAPTTPTPTISAAPPTTSAATTSTTTTTAAATIVPEILVTYAGPTCEDNPVTGIRFRSGEQCICSDLMPHCNHATLAPTIKATCRRSCGMCDIYVDHASAICQDQSANDEPRYAMVVPGSKPTGAEKLATCADMRPWCSMYTHSSAIAKKCPQTCGLCSGLARNSPVKTETVGSTKIVEDVDSTKILAGEGLAGEGRTHTIGFEDVDSTKVLAEAKEGQK